MDGSSFDRLPKACTEPRSRRGLSRLVGGLAVGGSLALLGVTESGAKKKKVTLCHQGQTISVSKKAKKKHLKHGDTLGACPSTTPPPGPVTGPGMCGDPSGAGGGMSSRRFAQTFFPPRSGQLTKAEIFLTLNPADFSLIFEIRSVTSGLPHVTLATTTVDGIPGTGAGDIQRFEVTFDTPATITLGQPYALVVSAATDFSLKTIGGGTPCPDGRLFTDAEALNAWVDSGTDLVYAVTIP